MMTDLSDYEKKRLENIKRNAAFLTQLGFDPVVKHEYETTKEKNNEALFKQQKKSATQKRKLDEIVPTRSSQRLRKMDAEVAARKELLPEVADSPQTKKKVTTTTPTHSSSSSYVDYELMPESSEELDDHEFQVYVILRAWRLKTSRELDIEPYKVCQNRTIAELVRRRRNDARWAHRRRHGYISADLVECWGIGPNKARPDGFGVQMAELMDSNEDIESHLRASREGKVISPTDNDDTPSDDIIGQVEIKEEAQK